MQKKEEIKMELPLEIWWHIALYLPIEDVGRWSRTCRLFATLLSEDSFWKSYLSRYLEKNLEKHLEEANEKGALWKDMVRSMVRIGEIPGYLRRLRVTSRQGLCIRIDLGEIAVYRGEPFASVVHKVTPFIPKDSHRHLIIMGSLRAVYDPSSPHLEFTREIFEPLSPQRSRQRFLPLSNPIIDIEHLPSAILFYFLPTYKASPP